MAGVTGRTIMFTNLRHLIPPLVYPRARMIFSPLAFVFLVGVMRSIIVRYIHLFIYTKVNRDS